MSQPKVSTYLVMTILGHFEPFPISSFYLFRGLSQYKILKITILSASVFSVIFHNIEYLSCCSYSHVWISQGNLTTLHYPHLNTDTFSLYSNTMVILLSGIYCLYCKQPVNNYTKGSFTVIMGHHETFLMMSTW